MRGGKGGQWKVTPHTKEKLLVFFSVSLAGAIFLADSQKCVTARSLLSLKAQQASEVWERQPSRDLSAGGGGALERMATKREAGGLVPKQQGGMQGNRA